MPLRVAIVHYHLRPGGVTRVIENAVSAVAGQEIETVVIAGEAYEGRHLKMGPELAGFQGLRVVPGLAYTSANEKPSASALSYDIRATARDAFGRDADIYHLHNHSLGKNNAFPEVARRLCEYARVLYQIHDFAEDGRPANYRTQRRHIASDRSLYPTAPHVHYAVLNRRDQSILTGCGLAEERTHLLPNPVAVGAGDLADESERRATRESLLGAAPGEADRLFLYPTRAIRRKNLGEMLLWAALGRGEGVFASTLSPANPEARPVYERWLQFAEELRLPVLFAVGEERGMTFPGLMAAADWTLTTSVAEGFGLAFLEPWLFQRGLLGRDLPDITEDFTRHGIDLGALYPRLDVPLTADQTERLRAKLDKALRATCQAYEVSVPDGALEAVMAATFNGERADFACLDEPLQEEIIQAAANGGLDGIGPLRPPENAPVEANTALIREHYSLPAYGKRLRGIYRAIAEAPRERLGHLDPEAVLRAFLKPERFRLLRT